MVPRINESAENSGKKAGAIAGRAFNAPRRQQPQSEGRNLRQKASRGGVCAFLCFYAKARADA